MPIMPLQSLPSTANAAHAVLDLCGKLAGTGLQQKHSDIHTNMLCEMSAPSRLCPWQACGDCDDHAECICDIVVLSVA